MEIISNRLTVASYCAPAHKQWVPQWVSQLNQQSLYDFDVLFVGHNWDMSHLYDTAGYLANNLRSPLCVQYKVMLYKSQPIIGPVINFAAQNVNTEYFAFQDMDDIMHPNRLKIQLDYLLQHPEIDFCSTRFIDFTSEMPPLVAFNDTSYWQPNANDPKTPHLLDTAAIKHYFFKRKVNPIAHGSMMCKTRILQKIPWSNDDVKTTRRSPDFEYWKKVIMAGYKFARLSDLLYFWRIGSTSIRK